MPTYVIRDGELVEKRFAGPRYASASAPQIITDELPTALRHMATGRMHTSKSEFRKDTKASGCIEKGDDSSLYSPRKPVVMDRGQRREAIKRAIYELRNGRS